jgi:hypothetical protein
MSNLNMKKQAFHLNRLLALNAELAKYTPAHLLKQAADYPTARNKQACAYYLGLKKQAAVEKKAFLRALGRALAGAYGLARSGIRSAAPHLGTAATAAGTGIKNFTVANPGKAVLGAGALTLGGEHYALPFLGDVGTTIKNRYNESETGVRNFLHRLRRGYDATISDPTSDYSSTGINKPKPSKVMESATPKAPIGIIPSKPSRWLEVEEPSIPPEFKSRSLPREFPQWRNGTRGQNYYS